MLNIATDSMKKNDNVYFSNGEETEEGRSVRRWEKKVRDVSRCPGPPSALYSCRHCLVSLFKAALSRFSTLKLQFQNHFYNSSTFNRDNSPDVVPCNFGYLVLSWEFLRTLWLPAQQPIARTRPSEFGWTPVTSSCQASRYRKTPFETIICITSLKVVC